MLLRFPPGICAFSVLVLGAAPAPGWAVTPTDESELSEITVRAQRVANSKPAGTYAALVTALRFDPQTELQARGLAEGQADVTVRGGVFENTGFVVGAVTVMDPQTGHYSAELPIDPISLSAPNILTGIDNALGGFNSNIATIYYSFAPISAGGEVSIGAGSDALSFQSLRLAKSKTLDNGKELSAAVSAALSRGDGSLPNGDHDFERYNIHVQHGNDNAQTDLILGYQDKFFGWPGMYTGFSTFAETDHTKTILILGNHRRDFGDGWYELGAYYRGLEDDYDFDRTTQESGAPGSFDHKTRIYAVGFQGLWRSGTIDWRYGGQLTGDKLVRSTDLTEGRFRSRSYATFSLIPSIEFAQSGDRTLSVRIGATLDASQHDSNSVSPVLGATIRRASPTGSNYFDIEYAAASQVPGYTALNSRPSGLFGGNPNLGREKARHLAVSVGKESLDWNGSATLFYRQDSKLTDWTYATESPFARQANPVDLDVLGFEAIAARNWNALDFVVGYTYLDKDSDYGTAIVDASFYALNFARHRATLALRYRMTDSLELRLDNEYRIQEDNPLRTNKDKTFLASIALAWESGNGLGLTLSADNVTDSDFQFFPGTPAVGRQISLSASYNW